MVRACRTGRASAPRWVHNRNVAGGTQSGFVPRLSIEAVCTRRGRQAVVAGCVALVLGDDSDADLIVALGGGHARSVLDGGPRPDQVYWFRVWAMRGLLWAWDDSALGAVLAGLADPAWRVREMSAKVIARHGLGDAFGAVAELRDDPVPRVRAAATRAVAVLTAAGA